MLRKGGCGPCPLQRYDVSLAKGSPGPPAGSSTFHSYKTVVYQLNLVGSGLEVGDFVDVSELLHESLSVAWTLPETILHVVLAAGWPSASPIPANVQYLDPRPAWPSSCGLDVLHLKGISSSSPLSISTSLFLSSPPHGHNNFVE